MSDLREHFLRTVVAAILFFASSASAPGSTIAPVKIDDLFKQADLVAIVRISSGDSEHYPVTVYKADVLESFKGTTPGEKFYFGPFVGFGVGSEYLVFLRKSENETRPKDKSPGINYGVLPVFYRIMYDGYSIMPIEYTCVFDGKVTSQKCDYGVELNPKQVILPSSIKTFPSGKADAVTNYQKWVRKDGLVSLLDQMKKNQVTHQSPRRIAPRSRE